MRHPLLLIALFALGALPPCALADFSGRVVKVADGDTLTVLVNKTQIRVRLDGIDAPESKQAPLRPHDWPRHLRRMSANNEQVRRGMAWVFARYVPVNSPLYELEAYARLRQIGLWVDPHPVAPWEWRASKRNL
jgi:endonuclease YncB( thermonuclease family)